MTNTLAGHTFIESNSSFKKSLIAISLLSIISPAYAQDIGTDKKEEEALLEIVEVYGIRASLAENLAIKRLANSFVDVITSEDIGKFPDKNVADSLQRVPGVVITRDGGEGSAVSIRGFGPGLTLTQLNGNYIASTPGEPNRQFDFELLPSNMIQRVEVIKSPEARHDEGGVGGTIRAYSHKPFDLDTNTTLVQLEATYADVTEEYDPNYSVLYSWKDEEEKFGFLVGYTKQERRNRTLTGEAQTWWWWRDDNNGNPSPPIDVNGNVIDQVADVRQRDGTSLADGTRYGQGFWGPQLVRGVVLDEERKREGVQATFQWRPTDNVSIGANYFGFKLGLDSLTNTMEIPEWSQTFNNGQGLVDSIDFSASTDQPGAIQRGLSVIEDADGTIGNTIHPWLRATYNKEESTSDTFDVFGEYEAETITVAFKAGKTEAEGGPTENFNLAYYGSNWPQQDPALIENASKFSNWSVNGETLNIGVDPNFHSNLANGIGGGLDPGSTNSSFTSSTQEETFAQIDIDVSVDWGIVNLVRIGVKSRDAKVTRKISNTYYLLPGSDGNDIGEQSYVNNGGIPALSAVLRDKPIDNIIGGFSTNSFAAVDINKYRDFLNANFDRLNRPDDLFTYRVGEKTLAYYLQADFEYDSFRGNFGVRAVETEQYGESTDLFVTRLDHTDDATGQFIENIEGVGFTQDFVLVRQDKETTEVLPSFNISWEPIEDLVFRGAIAQVISPAPLSTLGAQERLELITQEYFDDRRDFGAQLGWSGSGGNKNLEPFKALQADIGVEWYFSEASVLGAGYFQKDIDNFIVNAVIPTTRQINGQQVPVNPYRTSANGSDATVNGFEVFGSYTFDNGFGVIANATILDAEQTDVALDGQVLGTSPLPGTSDKVYNLSVFYEQDKYSVRASYNYRSELVLGLQDGLTAFLDEYDQIDINASYEISKHITLNVAVVNLTESEQYSYLGEDTKERFLSNSYSGRRFYAGLNISF